MPFLGVERDGLDCLVVLDGGEGEIARDRAVYMVVRLMDIGLHCHDIGKTVYIGAIDMAEALQDGQHYACFPNLVDGSRNLGERGLVVLARHYTLEPVSDKSLGRGEFPTRVSMLVATHEILCLTVGLRWLLQIRLGFIARRRI